MAVESLARPPKPVRAVNALCAFAAAARRGRVLPVADVIRVTTFDLTDTQHRKRGCLSDAEDRGASRLLRDLRRQGLQYEFRSTTHSTSDVEGYLPLGLAEPEPPNKESYGDWHKWIWLLWAGHKRLPVREVCRATRWTPRVLRRVLRSLSLCGLGPLPHELLDARIEGGRVIIEGPNPYAQVPRARTGADRGSTGHRG